MAHKKGASSTRNGRDSNAQRLGVKRFGGQLVNAGEIIVQAARYPLPPGRRRRPGWLTTPCLPWSRAMLSSAHGAVAGSST